MKKRHLIQAAVFVMTLCLSAPISASRVDDYIVIHSGGADRDDSSSMTGDNNGSMKPDSSVTDDSRSIEADNSGAGSVAVDDSSRDAAANSMAADDSGMAADASSCDAAASSTSADDSESHTQSRRSIGILAAVFILTLGLRRIIKLRLK